MTATKPASPSLLTRALRWFDDNILTILAVFLLAFIPLNPKIPLWSPIEQYIVRVRTEDILIFITGLVWVLQLLRRKIAWKSAMFWMILAYAFAGLVSILVAMFVIKTVPLQPLHIGKTVLHYFRYLEYFSLFVILFSAIRTRKDVKVALGVFALTILAISIYGYGQRYFYWPVYSTMNREFSKGIRLYLTQYARVQSTFAGHYDMAAFMVISLPLILAMAYKTASRWASTALHWIFWVGTWLLILSGSRAPFAAFIGGVAIVLGLTSLMQRRWVDKISFGISRGSVFLFFSVLLFYYFGADLTERLSHLANSNPQVQQFVATTTKQRQAIISDEELAMLPLSPTQLHAMLPKGQPPKAAKSTDEIAAEVAATAAVASSADQPPTPAVKPTPKPSPKPGSGDKDLPAGVYEDIPDEQVVASTSADGTTTYEVIKKPRVYSKCALEKELSLCIRLETLWPRAIEGFLTNPLTGSGYATLTKDRVDQFTEADSTDNNFLRTLGETGIFGFVTFYGCVGIVIYYAIRNVADKDRLVAAMSIGLLGGSIGLLLNAVYIDVFAASKVAQTYWALAGVFLGLLATRTEPSIQSAKPLPKSYAKADKHAR